MEFCAYRNKDETASALPKQPSMQKPNVIQATIISGSTDFPLKNLQDTGVFHQQSLGKVEAVGATIIFTVMFQIGTIVGWLTSLNIIIISLVTALFGLFPNARDNRFTSLVRKRVNQ